MFSGLDGNELTTASPIEAPSETPVYPAFREHLLGFGIARALGSRQEGPGTLSIPYRGQITTIAYEQAIHHVCVLKNLKTNEEFTATTYFVRHQGILTPIQLLEPLDPANSAYAPILNRNPHTPSEIPQVQALPSLHTYPYLEALRRLFAHTTRE